MHSALFHEFLHWFFISISSGVCKELKTVLITVQAICICFGAHGPLKNQWHKKYQTIQVVAITYKNSSPLMLHSTTKIVLKKRTSIQNSLVYQCVDYPSELSTNIVFCDLKKIISSSKCRVSLLSFCIHIQHPVVLLVFCVWVIPWRYWDIPSCSKLY